MSPLHRRTFIVVSTVLAFVAIDSVAYRVTPPHTNESFSAPLSNELDVLIAAGHFSVDLGQMYLHHNVESLKFDISSLRNDVLVKLANDGTDLLSQIERRILNDFATGDLCQIDGWTLSSTECKVAAIAYLFKRDGGHIHNSSAKSNLDYLNESIIAPVDRWGPQIVSIGKGGFNLQSNGNSALWIRFDGLDEGPFVVYIGSLAAQTTVQTKRNLITASLSKQQVDTLMKVPTEVPVYLVDHVTSTKQLVGHLLVRAESR